jgi:hypothetical protein
LKKYLLLFFLLIASTCCALAQVYAFGGVHKSYVRNEVLLGESPIYSWHIGLGIKFIPQKSRKKFSINTEMAFTQKGYDQQIGNQEFEFRFRYIAAQGTLNYSVFPFLSVKAGLNLALLMSTNIDKGTSTYQSIDVGAVGELGFLENKRMSFYTQVVYGFVPMLKYYNIDALGNFNGEIHDLKNTCFMVGLRINLFHEKAPVQN